MPPGTNPYVALLLLLLQSVPNLPSEVKEALLLIAQLIPVYEQKKSGWITFVPDDGTPPTQLAHIQF